MVLGGQDDEEKKDDESDLDDSDSELEGMPQLTALFSTRTSRMAQELEGPEEEYDEDDLFQEGGQDPLLYQQSIQPGSTLTTQQDNPTSEFNFKAFLDAYPNPYEALSALLIRTIPETKSRQGQTAHFKDRLDSARNAIAYMLIESKKELESADPNEKEALQKRIENFQALDGFMIYLRALARNKCRVSNKELNEKLGAIEQKLKASGQPEEVVQMMRATVREVVGANTYTDGRIKFFETHLGGIFAGKHHAEEGRRFYHNKGLLGFRASGSTEFDTTKPTMNIHDFIKRVKVEHNAEGQIHAHLSYNRHRVLGTSTMYGHLKLRGSKHEVGVLKNQARDLARIALFGYGRGTSQDNPLSIRSNGPSQPEAILAVIMEYKKLAIEMGRDFHALTEDGQPVKITPDPNFSQEEMDYFMKYAFDEIPVVNSRIRGQIPAKECAGYKLLKHESELTPSPSREEIQSALQSHFDKLSKEKREVSKDVVDAAKKLTSEAERTKKVKTQI